jgi:hypothetical protein
MMTKAGIAAMAVAVAVLAAAPAMACSCPKEKLVKKYGTVSQIHQPVPLPPPLPAIKAVTPTG